MEAQAKISSTELTYCFLQVFEQTVKPFFISMKLHRSGSLMICSPRKSYQSNMIPYILLTVATANENGELLVDEVMSALAATISHSLKCPCG